LFAVESGHDGTTKNEAVTPPPPVAAVPAAAAAASSSPTEALARIDALHRRRDEPAALAEETKLITDRLARAPGDFEVLWRAARFYFWMSDDPGTASEQRSKLGKTGWDLAERAILANPGQAAGYYWSAVTMGNYALGLGVVKALTMGMEDKFKSRLARAEQLAPDYQFGGVDVAWGRFYEKLPWPKRDRKKAELHLRRALKRANGVNLRARVYLADTLAHDSRAAEGKKLLEEVAAAPVGRYDAPEERRAKALGVGLMPALLKMMN
jgi:hypothetical protein